MPLKLDRNLRSGNLKEELGLLLLKGIGAVAEVQRTQDFGIDAIVTLLRPESARELYAEKTCFVQLKSESVKKIEYNQEQSIWLRKLQLPILFGTVEGEPGTISLYPGHMLSCAFHDGWEGGLVVHIGGEQTYEDTDGLRHVHLGEALLQWQLPQVFDRDHHKKAYSLLDQYLDLETANIVQRDMRVVDYLTWKTNERVERLFIGLTSSRKKDEVERAMKAMIPSILALAPCLTESEQDMAVIGKMMDMLRRHGIPFDPSGTLDLVIDGTVHYLK